MLRIAHFGTFDVNNYGDLLFPHIAEYRLPNHKWEHISPTNRLTAFKDSKPIISFEEAKNRNYDAMVTGGGNIVHLSYNNKTVYKSIKGFSYANLWVGAAKLAIKNKIPHIFNAPGVSENFTTFFKRKIAKTVFRKSEYVSFRENLSLKLVSKLSNNKFNISIVPDTAFEINKLWPIKSHEKGSYITVNLNERYHTPINKTASALDKLSEKFNLPIKFVVIGACHGDKEFTAKVSKKMTSKHEIVESNELKKMALTIGEGRFFLGSSMHGFITALSYSVPTILVLNNKPMHKFIGLLELTGIHKNSICCSFEDALSVTHPAFLTEIVKKKIESQLNLHWSTVDKAIKTGNAPSYSFFICCYEKLLDLNLKFYRILKKLNLKK